MTIYLVIKPYIDQPQTAFTCKKVAQAYTKESKYLCIIKPIELVTDQFMEQILQPKESHEINTNSSL